MKLSRIIALGIALLILFAMFGGLALAQATTYIVNTTDDVDEGACNTGHCSLREAINAANGDAVTSTIAFNIPMSDPGFSATTSHWSIRPTSSLPTITAPVVIDGYTQPGASPNTNGPGLGLNTVLKIELDGTNAGANANGLHLTGGDSTVRGLVINRFDESGVLLETKGGTAIEGNFIGTDVTGISDLGNGYDGVRVEDTPNHTIGGMTTQVRNIISGNRFTGVRIGLADATGNLVQGNLIGTDVTGTIALGNEDGVHIMFASSNTIGGTNATARNVISGNVAHGLTISGPASGNLIQSNYIGISINGATSLGNGGWGVVITGASGNRIGGISIGAANTIAYNGGDGVYPKGGTENSIQSNSIFGNGNLGIDFNDDGITPNDPGDADSGPNNLQNFPVLASAQLDTNGTLAVEYSVDSATANSAYPLQIELFKADADGEEGQTFLGSDTYTSSDAQNAKSMIIGGAAGLGLVGGDVIVGTATDANNNTSEFSAGVQITAVATPIPGLTPWGVMALGGVLGVLLLWRARRVSRTE